MRILIAKRGVCSGIPLDDYPLLPALPADGAGDRRQKVPLTQWLLQHVEGTDPWCPRLFGTPLFAGHKDYRQTDTGPPQQRQNLEAIAIGKTDVEQQAGSVHFAAEPQHLAARTESHGLPTGRL